MVTLEEAKAQAQAYRQQLSEQQELVRQNESAIAQQRTKLPSNISQRALRQQMSGLKGRETRRTIEGIKQDLSNKEGYIKQVKGELGGFEGEISEYEKGIAQYEAELKAAEERQAAIASVERAADKGTYELGLLAIYGEGLEKEYAQEWVKRNELDREAWIADIRKFESTLPAGDKVVIDWGKMKVTGVDSPTLGRSLDMKSYIKEINTLNTKITDPTFKANIKDITPLDIKEPETKRNFEIFPMVSASSNITSKVTGIVREPIKQPALIVEKAPTLGEQYKTSIENNKLSGTVTFAAQKASGFVSNVLQKSGFTFSQASGIGSGIGTVLASPNIVIRPSEEVFKIFTAPKLPNRPEVYAPTFDMFYKETPTGESGTTSFRQPTTVERQNIYGTFSENPESIIARQRKIQELYRGFDDLSYEEQQKRLRRIESYGGSSPVTYSFFGVTKQLNPSELDYKTPTGFKSSARSAFISKVVSDKLVSKGYPEQGFFYITPEKKVEVRLPQYGTVQYDSMGKPKDYFLTEVTIPEKKEYTLSAKTIGDVAATSPYFIPYAGLGLYAGENILKLKEEVSQEKGIKKGAIQFVKDYPMDALLIGGFGAFKLAKGVKGFAFTPRENLLVEGLKPKIPTTARNVMYPEEVIAITDKGMTTSRKFVGQGIAEDLTQGSRRYFSTRFQDLFGLKPTYSGKYTGDILIKDTIFGNQKVITISAKEAKAGYKQVKEMLVEKGMTEQQARNYLARTSAKRTGYATNFRGEILVGEGSPLISIQGERLSRGLKETIYLNPTRRIQIASPTRVGKLKQEEVSTLLEEYKTKAPKGKEEGSIGETSFFRGSSEEYVPVKSRTFNEGAIAKKTGEESFDLGKIETYKTGEVSKETTYLKPKKVSGSQSQVIVINPNIQKETVYDLVTGLKTVRVKPSISTTGDLTRISAEDWIKVSEEQLPIKLEGKSNILKPANIKKTPMSKTFGSEQEYVELYHGTTKESAEQIKQFGLQGDTSLTTNKEFAQSFANRKTVQERMKGVQTQPEVLTIKIPKEEYLKAKQGTKSKFYEEVVINKKSNYKVIEPISNTNVNSYQILEKAPKITEKEIGKVASDISNILKPSKIITKPRELIESNYPRMVGGTGVVESSFAGGVSMNVEEKSMNLPAIKENVLSRESNITKTDIGQIPKMKLDTRTNLGTQPSSREGLKLNEILKVKSSELQNVGQQQNLVQRTNQKTKQKTNKNIVKTKVPIKPIIKPSLTKRVLTKVQNEPDIFEAFITKEGKQVSLGKKQTQQGAESLLKGKLTSTLSASGLIKRGKETLKASELKSFGTREFRLSKQSEFKIVERKEKRLRKSTTGKEIQLFRGKKIKGGIF